MNFHLTEKKLANKVSWKGNQVEITGTLAHFFNWIDKDSLVEQVIYEQVEDTAIYTAIRWSPKSMMNTTALKGIFYQATNYTYEDSLIGEKYWQIRASETIPLSLCQDSTLIELAYSDYRNVVEMVCEKLTALEVLFSFRFDERIRFDASIPLNRRYNIEIPYLSIPTMEGYQEPLLKFGLVLEKKEILRKIRVIKKVENLDVEKER